MGGSKQLTVGSLFSGIGGLDLGLERAGMRVIWNSEIDPYCCRLLKKHWPEVPNHGDIKQINWDTIERPDVICGGYPCQPFSAAGHRKGEEDERHLWPWVREAICLLRPKYAILENVRGHLSLGGLTVIGDLASIGYDAEWRIISAASVGANHRRDRIVIVAYPNNNGQPSTEVARSLGKGGDSGSPGSKPASEFERCGEQYASVAYAHGSGRNKGGLQERKKSEEPCSVVLSESVAYSDGEQLGQYGIAPNAGQEDRRRVYNGGGQTGYVGWEWWQVEPDVGRVAHGIPNRVDRLRGLGNAVVPQVAEVVGRLVVAHYEQNLPESA